MVVAGEVFALKSSSEIGPASPSSDQVTLRVNSAREFVCAAIVLASAGHFTVCNLHVHLSSRFSAPRAPDPLTIKRRIGCKRGRRHKESRQSGTYNEPSHRLPLIPYGYTAALIF